MSEILNKIRKELYKISEIDTEDEIINIYSIEEFINNLPYLRNAPEEEIIENYKRFFYSSTTYSIKLLFFIRDKVNGLGEKRIFRVLIKYLANEHTNYIKNNLKLIPKYGRWDDLYSLFGTKLEENAIDLFKTQIQIDITSKTPSTLGKWLKSENTSSKESKKLGSKTRKLLGYSPKEYRRLLSSLRKRINIIESNLSSKDYKKINYKNLTKFNIKRYKRAFLRNDNTNYKKFISEKNKNEFIFNDPVNLINVIRNNLNNENINSVEYMYIKNLKYLLDEKIQIRTSFEDTFIINALPNELLQCKDKYFDILIMTILLFKKINLNSFKNYYMYFKRNSKFNKLAGDSYIEDIKIILTNSLNNNDNINLESALDLILFTSIKKDLKQEFIPKSIMFIYNSQEDIEISDFKSINTKWINNGYNMPKIKLWNLKNLSEKFSIINKNNFIRITGYSDFSWNYFSECKEINNNDLIINKFNKIQYNDLFLT